MHQRRLGWWLAALLGAEITGGLFFFLQPQQQPTLAFSSRPLGVKTRGLLKPRSCGLPRGAGTLCRLASNDDEAKPTSKKKKQKSKQNASTNPSTRIKGEAAAPSKKKTTKSKKQKSTKSDEPIHWICDQDPLVYKTTTNSTAILLRFTIRGNPLPLRRHRTSRGFVYNPSAKAQESFRQKVQELLCTNFISTPPALARSNTTDKSTLFENDTALAMTIVFRTKRPNTDFIGGRPGAGRLRQTPANSNRTQRVAPNRLHPPTRIDVDNLAKFVLDSLNGVLYDDDKQVVSLQVTKLRDDDGECKGSTEVCIRVIRPEDVDTLLERMFHLF